MENRILTEKINGLPDQAGVYFFKDAQERVIYVGKANNIKKRVKNHFQKPDQHAFDFISQIAGIDFIKTDSERAALLLEQQFIKKLQPRWNTEWKDDKNYFYIALSGGKYPRVYLTHQPNLVEVKPPLSGHIGGQTSTDCSTAYGPFVSGKEVKSFLREIRKAIPYRTCRNGRAGHDRSEGLPQEACFYRDLGLCLAPCSALSNPKGMDKKAKSVYPKMLAVLRVLLQIYQGEFAGGPTPGIPGKPPRDLRGLDPRNRRMRIEGYDVSNLAGTLAVGSMVVFENGKANKNQYRKFKIKTIQGQNDVASLREILTRRLKHNDWPLPDLIVLDGGKGQLKAAKGIDIPVVALAKIGDKNGKLFSRFSKNYSQLSKLPANLANLFLQIRDESHRFAIGYNKKRRLINYQRTGLLRQAKR